uniref:Uncharacterized protein n=1 Tax=Rhizophora mucronata TaxID=61149 RepID=A0A2P2N7T9_RHIMU
MDLCSRPTLDSTEIASYSIQRSVEN